MIEALGDTWWHQRLGYDLSVCRAICELADIPLGQHRMAAYVRSVDYLPRVFFSVSTCRFYGLPEGNFVTHASVCSHLYVRLCALPPRVAECLNDALGGEVVYRCNFIFYVLVGGACY